MKRSLVCHYVATGQPPIPSVGDIGPTGTNEPGDYRKPFKIACLDQLN